MRDFTGQEMSRFRHVFRKVWHALLMEERITAENIAQVPDLIVECMLASFEAGASDEPSLFGAAMEGMMLFENAEAVEAEAQEDEVDFVTIH